MAGFAPGYPSTRSVTLVCRKRDTFMCLAQGRAALALGLLRVCTFAPESTPSFQLRRDEVECLARTRNNRPLRCVAVANTQDRVNAEAAPRPRVLFICGSLNQTTQLHAVSRALPDVHARFSPFYGAAAVSALRDLGLIENTIGGRKLRDRCVRYLESQSLPIDFDGGRGPYDLVVGCTDVALPDNLGAAPLVVVQEGILDPNGVLLHWVQRFPRLLPRWLAGTAASGLSGKYARFCVASEGYRNLFVSRGAPAERLVVTGIPNFDDCASFRQNDFPHRGYVLVCSSDARETFKRHDRPAFIRRCLRIAGRRQLFFKLHPNENAPRARRELRELAPGASIFSEGPTEAMVANCSVLITEWSSVAFVGLALGKEVHSSHSLAELRELLPEQNRSAAQRIAQVCEGLLAPFRARAEPAAPKAAE